MIRLCSHCKCELNNQNCAKKDAHRFRRICRACFRIKRNKSRELKKVQQGELLGNLIDQQIIKIEPSPKLVKITKEKKYKGYSQFLKEIVRIIKEVVKVR